MHIQIIALLLLASSVPAPGCGKRDSRPRAAAAKHKAKADPACGPQLSPARMRDLFAGQFASKPDLWIDRARWEAGYPKKLLDVLASDAAIWLAIDTMRQKGDRCRIQERLLGETRLGEPMENWRIDPAKVAMAAPDDSIFVREFSSNSFAPKPSANWVVPVFRNGKLAGWTLECLDRNLAKTFGMGIGPVDANAARQEGLLGRRDGNLRAAIVECHVGPSDFARFWVLFDRTRGPASGEYYQMESVFTHVRNPGGIPREPATLKEVVEACAKSIASASDPGAGAGKGIKGR
jgi:hypothetical protein